MCARTYAIVVPSHCFPGKCQTGRNRRGHGEWQESARWTGKLLGTGSWSARHSPGTGWRLEMSHDSLLLNDHSYSNGYIGQWLQYNRGFTIPCLPYRMENLCPNDNHSFSIKIYKSKTSGVYEVAQLCWGSAATLHSTTPVFTVDMYLPWSHGGSCSRSLWAERSERSFEQFCPSHQSSAPTHSSPPHTEPEWSIHSPHTHSCPDSQYSTHSTHICLPYTEPESVHSTHSYPHTLISDYAASLPPSITVRQLALAEKMDASSTKWTCLSQPELSMPVKNPDRLSLGEQEATATYICMQAHASSQTGTPPLWSWVIEILSLGTLWERDRVLLY